MTGCGPPRSGWVMNVVVWPSLVGISICWSIMGYFFIATVSRVSCLARTSIRLQGNCNMTSRLALAPTTPALNSALRIAIVLLSDHCAHDREIFDMTQTINRFLED